VLVVAFDYHSVCRGGPEPVCSFAGLTLVAASLPSVDADVGAFVF
jgi:hypothetical protein